MIKSSFSIVVFSLISALPSHALAADSEPIRYSPEKPWTLDYANNRCTLSRTFMQGENKASLFMSQYSPGDSFDMIIIGNDIGIRLSNTTAKVQFGPFEKEQKIEFFPGNTNNEDTSMIVRRPMRISPRSEQESKARDAKDVLTLALIAAEQKSNVEYISVRTSKKNAFFLETGSLKAPFDALQKCNEDLLTDWGIDVEKFSTKLSEAIPKSNPGSWITSNDYPNSQLRKGAQALIKFKLNVDENGEVTRCDILNSIGDEAFDNAVCKSLSRNAEFEPAMDKDAQPMSSIWISQVTFEIG